MNNPPQPSHHTHYNQQNKTTPKRDTQGVYSLGLLTMIVKAGETARNKIAYTPQLTPNKLHELKRTIWQAKQAKQRLDTLKTKHGYQSQKESAAEAAEAQNFDEALKQELIIKIYLNPDCPLCQKEAEHLKKRGQNLGEVQLINIPPNSEKHPTWTLSPWPHIEADGREITPHKLEELIMDARYIRALTRTPLPLKITNNS